MRHTSTQTAAATAARHARTQQMLIRVDKAIKQIAREQGKVTVRAVARRAEVSSTFLYENTEARTLINAVTTRMTARHTAAADEIHDAAEATWRERALNAEAALTQAQTEIRAQRRKVGELMGQIRDLGQTQTGESVERLVAENANLKQQLRQLTKEHRAIQERLEAARSNNRFADRQIAELEAQLLDTRHPAPDLAAVTNIDSARTPPG